MQQKNETFMKAPLQLHFANTTASNKRRHGTPAGFYYEYSFCKASWFDLPNGKVILQEYSGSDYGLWQWNFELKNEVECFIEADSGTILLLQPLQVHEDVFYLGDDAVKVWPKMYLFFYMPCGRHKIHISGPTSFYLLLQPPLSFLEGLKAEVEGVAEMLSNYLQGSKRFYYLPIAPILSDNRMRLKKLDVPSFKKGIPDLYLRNYIIEVLHDFVKTAKEKPSSQLFYSTTKYKATLLRAYVEEQLTDPSLYNMETFGKKFYADPRSLNRAFQQQTGKTILQYIIEKRLLKAKVYIEETKLPIKEITFLCGYTDVSHFIRIFSNRFGTTPGRMRGNNAV